jgi:hypothetical protein
MRRAQAGGGPPLGPSLRPPSECATQACRHETIKLALKIVTNGPIKRRRTNFRNQHRWPILVSYAHDEHVQTRKPSRALARRPLLSPSSLSGGDGSPSFAPTHLPQLAPAAQVDIVSAQIVAGGPPSIPLLPLPPHSFPFHQLCVSHTASALGVLAC